MYPKKILTPLTPVPPAPKTEYPQSPPKATYKTGDGDMKTSIRPGSCHKHLKSFGHLT